MKRTEFLEKLSGANTTNNNALAQYTKNAFTIGGAYNNMQGLLRDITRALVRLRHFDGNIVIEDDEPLFDELLIEPVAKDFGRVLAEWLSSYQMEDVIKKNKTDPDCISGRCCTSHDYCDANMAMDEAFQKVMGRDFFFFDEDQPETERQHAADMALINAAWTVAKDHNFYYHKS